MNNSEGIVSILIGLALIIILFIILRELVMWYWKINERINLQKETNAYLRKLVELQKSNNEPTDKL